MSSLYAVRVPPLERRLSGWPFFCYNQFMTKITPKDFFLHLGAIVTLFGSALSLLTLVFHVVNLRWPDNLETYVDPYSAGMRWAIAFLVIVFPLFLLLAWRLAREYKREPAKLELGLRKWLIYFTLFVTGAALIVDLITLLNYFLGGEITTRFILKVLAVLVVSGLVFGYYFNELRPARRERCGRRMALVSTLLVLLALVGGFWLLGSPRTQRLIRLDEQRVNDLQSIQWQIINYWQQKGKLPASLTDLNDPLANFVPPLDPGTNLAYRYQKGEGRSFQLCANFNLASRSMTKPVSDNWQHGAGETCFDRSIDKELYPVNPKARPID